jgi:hypothetical protein
MEQALDKYAVVAILFNLYNEYLTKETLEGFGDFRIGEK